MNKRKTKLFNFVILLTLIAFISSCRNQAMMFRTKKNYPFEDLSKIPDTREYKIATNDELTIIVNPNKGASLLEGGENGQQTNNNNQRGIPVTVDFDGTIKLPVLGRVKITDLNVREAELLMENLLKTFYVDPYVTIKIQSKRVILFSGAAGNARVIPLQYQNMNLMEVLAISGGIPTTGKAHRIKIIRGNLKNPQIFLIDLSKIEGLKTSDLIVQGDDIIYVDFRNDYVQNFLTRIGPSLGLINLAVTTYFLLNLVK
jgi:polysaccharide export outer membrane protein